MKINNKYNSSWEKDPSTKVTVGSARELERAYLPRFNSLGPKEFSSAILQRSVTRVWGVGFRHDHIEMAKAYISNLVQWPIWWLGCFSSLYHLEDVLWEDKVGTESFVDPASPTCNRQDLKIRRPVSFLLSCGNQKFILAVWFVIRIRPDHQVESGFGCTSE